MVAVAVGAFFVFFEPRVVVADEVACSPSALVEDEVVETVEPTLGGKVHLANGLCVIAGFGKFPWQCRRILEGVVAGHGQSSVVPLVHSCENAGSGRRAGWDGSVGVTESSAILGKLVEVGGLEDGVTVAAEAVAPLLVCRNEDDVGFHEIVVRWP